MSTVFLIFVVIIGLTVIVGCGYWVLSRTVTEGVFRVHSQSLKTCPQCGTALDTALDHCPKCSLRTSV